MNVDPDHSADVERRPATSAPPGTPPGSTRRRTWLRWSVAFICFAVVAAAVVVPVWVLHYQPVNARIGLVGAADGSSMRSGPERYLVPYRDGAAVLFQVELSNPSRFAATVTLSDTAPIRLLKFTELRVFDDYPVGCCLPENARPIDFPLRLAPHTVKYVNIEFLMTGCEGAGRPPSSGHKAFPFDSLVFDSETLGVHHSIDASLDRSLEIRVPMAESDGCPGV